MAQDHRRKKHWIGKAVFVAAVLLAAFFGFTYLGPMLSEKGIVQVRSAAPAEEGLRSSDPASESQAVITKKEAELPAGIVDNAISVSTEEIPHLESKYLLAGLSDELMADFAELYRATANFENFCYFPVPITKEETGLLVTLLHTECPELFQNDSAATYHMESAGDLVRNVSIPYLMGKTQYDEELAKCREVLAEITEKADTLESDYEKQLEVYRQICSRSSYDLEDPRSGDAAGVLIGGKGKCDGFSLAFKWAMDELGIPCIVVAGTSLTEGAPGHAWNVVQTEGTWCVTDVTQDCNSENRSILCYPAFNTSDEWYEAGYTVPEEVRSLGLPDCDTVEKSYHVRNNSYIRSGEEKVGFFRAMSRAVSEGGTTPVQFESEEGWKTFTANSQYWAEDWMNENRLFGTSSYLAIDTFRTAQICVSVNENNDRIQQISDSLSVFESEIEADKKEINERKDSIERLSAEIADVENLAEEMLSVGTETWNDDTYEEYNALVARYDALAERYRQEVEAYNSLVEIYRDLCDSYNELAAEYNALTGSGG